MATNVPPMSGGGGLTGEAERLAEAGRPLPQPATIQRPGSGIEPPNNGLWVVPHFNSFAAVWNSVSRTYRFQFDEALANCQENALAYLKDPVVGGALHRTRPVAALPWHIEPRRDSDPCR